MDVTEIITTAREALTVKRIFGEPYEKDGVTLIPAAKVAGGFGGGEGQEPNGQQGQGGGFGISGRPVGVYVLKDGDVTWRPAVDANRVITVAGVLVAAYLLSRARRARRCGSRDRT